MCLWHRLLEGILVGFGGDLGDGIVPRKCSKSGPGEVQKRFESVLHFLTVFLSILVTFWSEF